MESSFNISQHLGASLKSKQPKERLHLVGHYKFVARRKDGSIKWTEEINNLIVNTGLNRVLSDVLKGGADGRITTWYIGLKNAGTPAAADTPSSHATWTENQNYSESVRQTLTLGTVSGQSVDNSASPAVFSINTNSQTIAGAFLISVSTKGATTGELFSVGDFGSAKALDSGETLEVTVTFTTADA